MEFTEPMIIAAGCGLGAGALCVGLMWVIFAAASRRRSKRKIAEERAATSEINELIAAIEQMVLSTKVQLFVSREFKEQLSLGIQKLKKRSSLLLRDLDVYFVKYVDIQIREYERYLEPPVSSDRPVEIPQSTDAVFISSVETSGTFPHIPEEPDPGASKHIDYEKAVPFQYAKTQIIDQAMISGGAAKPLDAVERSSAPVGKTAFAQSAFADENGETVVYSQDADLEERVAATPFAAAEVFAEQTLDTLEPPVDEWKPEAVVPDAVMPVIPEPPPYREELLSKNGVHQTAAPRQSQQPSRATAVAAAPLHPSHKQPVAAGAQDDAMVTGDDISNKLDSLFGG